MSTRKSAHTAGFTAADWSKTPLSAISAARLASSLRKTHAMIMPIRMPNRMDSTRRAAAISNPIAAPV